MAGAPGQALADLSATEVSLGEWVPPPPLREQSLLTQADLLAQVGDVASAHALIERVGPSQTDTGQLLQVRLHLRLGESAAARETLDRVNTTHPRARIDARIAGALLAGAEGDEDRALGLLEDALVAAAPFALRRPFLVGPDLTDLLARRLGHGSAASEFALDVLGRSFRASPTGERRELVEPLTERERIALGYLSGSLSNAEIAAALYVSVNTVKTHQGAVYRKLRASGRRDAVRRARALGLL